MARRIVLLVVVLGALAVGVFHFFGPKERPLAALLPKDVYVVELVRLDELEQPGTVGSFDVDPEGRPVLLVGGSVFVRFDPDGKRKPQTIPLRGTPYVSDFSWMDDGSLLVVAQQELSEVTGGGLRPIQSLPRHSMRVRPASAAQCYLYGADSPGEGRDLYIYRKGGELLQVLEAEGPIGAVAGDGSSTFVAIDRSVYLLLPEEPLTLVCRAAQPIRSLALGSGSVLFYATDSSVGMSAGPGNGVEFVKGRGGELRVHGEALYLFTPSQGLMKFFPVSRLVRMAREVEDG